MTKSHKFTPISLTLVTLFGLSPVAKAAGITNGLSNDQVRENSYHSNTEEVIVQRHFVLHALPEIKPTTTQLSEVKQTPASAEFVKDSAIRFVSGKHFLTGSTKQEMDRIIDFLQGKKQLKIHFIGHADSQRLSPNAKRIYKTNQGLSEHRANIVAEYFRQQLGILPSATTMEGRSNHDPVASNDTLEGMARNRRVEVIAVYVEEKTSVKTIVNAGPDRRLICDGDFRQQAAMAITLDGKPFASSDSANNADAQRCADVALEKMQLQLKYNPLDALPKLSVAHAITESGDTLMLHLKGYSNYINFFEYAEVHIMSPNGTDILKKVPLGENLEGKWRLPGNMLGMSLNYRLRVYDKSGRFDETSFSSADFRPKFAVANEKVNGYLMANYGKSQLAKQNIKVDGGTLTLFGEEVPDRHSVYFLGRVVAITRERKFVHQQIVRTGYHKAEVAVLNEEGNGALIQRDLALPKSDWFYVAMADLTVGQNSHNGPVELLSDAHNKDNNLFAEGRLAAYITGKWEDEYKVTARIDTREAPLNELFSNLHEKDPKSLFRRLEEQKYVAEYGDDSTVIDDAPSNGKVYLKIAKDHSQVMWGNFNTQVSDTELSRVERGLYGLQTQYRSNDVTSFGEHNSKAEIYVAEAETLPAYETHRATGGSLYYLQHQDIVLGSDQVAIEIRDKISGLVLIRRNLTPGQDYDMDALQGRILLTRPLSSFAADDLLVRAASFDDNPAYLVTSYEYTPGFSELDNLTYGGRVSKWLTDQVQLGITANKQQLDEYDDTLIGLDATYRHSASSYVKVEVAQTDGIASQLNSFNGGFSFDEIRSGQGPVKANGIRLEAATSFKEFGLESDGQAQFYWQRLEQGFAGLGQVNADEANTAGIMMQWQATETTAVKVKADDNKVSNRYKRQAAEINVTETIDKHWQASAGIRQDERRNLTQVQNQSQNTASSKARNDEGKRTDTVVQLSYQSDANWSAYGFVQGTLANDATRLRNNRIGLGTEVQITESVSLNGEVSEGNLGFAGTAGIDYAYSDKGNVYLNYRLDPDGSDLFNNAEQKQWVSGARHRFNDSTSVYAEQQWQHDDRQQGLTHAYGVDHSINSRWQVQLGLENGNIDMFENGRLERSGVNLGLGYQFENIRWAGALEYRTDETEQEKRTNWLMRNNFSVKLNEDWRGQLRVDTAISDSDQEAQSGAFNSDFTEAQLGFAYRPIDASPWSGLASLTYLEDLAPAQQLSGIGRDNTPQQRSTVWAVDVNYQFSPRWRFGTKLAQRTGEIRLVRDEGPWFDSTATLSVLRADYHLQHNWDATLEWRMLKVSESQDRRSGALGAIHRHIGENMKIGIGYNFTNFSDDLTDLDYDSKGWFINMVGKF